MLTIFFSVYNYEMFVVITKEIMYEVYPLIKNKSDIKPINNTYTSKKKRKKKAFHNIIRVMVKLFLFKIK